MRKWLALLLALLLCGCAGGESASHTGVPPAGTSQPEGQTAAPQPGDGEIAFSDPGQCRIEHTGQTPWVRYVTSPDQLPEQEALADFDEAFFRDNALVVLCITLRSGSIRPRIGQILCTDGLAEVRIVRETEGDQLTQDLAAWLLWARVDRDLRCGFRLEEDFLPQGAEKY